MSISLHYYLTIRCVLCLGHISGWYHNFTQQDPRARNRNVTARNRHVTARNRNVTSRNRNVTARNQDVTMNSGYCQWDRLWAHSVQYVLVILPGHLQSGNNLTFSAHSEAYRVYVHRYITSSMTVQTRKGTTLHLGYQNKSVSPRTYCSYTRINIPKYKKTIVLEHQRKMIQNRIFLAKQWQRTNNLPNTAYVLHTYKSCRWNRLWARSVQYVFVILPGHLQDNRGHTASKTSAKPTSSPATNSDVIFAG